MRWALSILSAEEYAQVQHSAVRYADEQADQSVLTRLTALAEYLEGHCEEASK